MIRFVLLFFLPLLLGASSGNKFEIGTIGQKPLAHHFSTYPYENFELEKNKFTVDNRNQIWHQIELMKQALQQKQATIYFSHLSSIKFYIDYCLEFDADSEPLKKDLLNCYELIKENTAPRQPNQITLIPNLNDSSSALIKLLEDVSNNQSRTNTLKSSYCVKIEAIKSRHPPKNSTYRCSKPNNFSSFFKLQT